MIYNQIRNEKVHKNLKGCEGKLYKFYDTYSAVAAGQSE